MGTVVKKLVLVVALLLAGSGVEEASAFGCAWPNKIFPFVAVPRPPSFPFSGPHVDITRFGPSQRMIPLSQFTSARPNFPGRSAPGVFAGLRPTPLGLPSAYLPSVAPCTNGLPQMRLPRWSPSAVPFGHGVSHRAAVVPFPGPAPPLHTFKTHPTR